MKILVFVFLIFFLIPFHCYGQTSLDKYFQALELAKPNNYQLICQKIENIILQLPAKEVLIPLEKFILITKKLSFKNAQCYALVTFEKVYYHILQDNSQALYFALQAYQLAKENNLKLEQANAGFEISRLYGLYQMNDKTAEFALDAIKIYEDLGLSEQATLAFYNLGLAYYRADNLEEAIYFLSKATSNTQNVLGKREKINLWNAIGLCALKKKNYPEAIQNFEKGLKLAEQFKDSVWIGILYGNIGEILFAQRDYPKAIEYLKMDITYSKKYKENSNALNSLRVLGDLYFEIGNLENAKKQYEQALNISIDNKNREYEVKQKLFISLAKWHAKKNNAGLTYDFYEKAYALNDSISEKKKQTQLERLKFINDLEKKEKELISLQKTNLSQEQIIVNQGFQRIILAIVIFFLLTFAYILYLANKQKIKSNQLLQEQNEEINTKNDKIEEQNQELKQQQDELRAQNDFIEAKNAKLENINERLRSNEQVFQKAYMRLKEKEKIIQDQNLQLKQYNENLESQVKARTKELEDKNLELINYNNQLEQFAFITAHNIRAPIARLMGLASIYNKEDLTNPQNLWVVDKMDFTARELDQIVKDLNSILEVKKGIIELIEIINLNDKIIKIEKLLEQQIYESQAEIHTIFEAGSELHTVGVYIESILYNLISNAIKYRSPDRLPIISIQTQNIEQYFVLIVGDNGLGIDLDKYGDKLFALYQRFHNHVEGKGLGLHLVKLQVEALGGFVEVHSTLNQGTTFNIFFKQDTFWLGKQAYLEEKSI